MYSFLKLLTGINHFSPIAFYTELGHLNIAGQVAKICLTISKIVKMLFTVSIYLRPLLCCRDELKISIVQVSSVLQDLPKAGVFQT